MKQFVRGQKARLTDITAATNLKVALSINGASPHLSFDISCFGVDAADKLSDDRYFIFYNQKSSPCNSLVALGTQANDKEVFQINLSQLPTTIRKLVFTITVDGAGTMSQVTNGYLRILDSGTEVARFDFAGTDFKDEKAIIAAEIYYKDAWRFAAVGQGFNGGLNALLKHFGGEEVEEQTPPAKPEVQKPATKVKLEKSGDSHKINLAKNSPELFVHVNLNWDAKASGSSFFGRKVEKPDLDLGCMYETAIGEIGVIQPVGNNFGSKTTTPYIFLDKDDRSGAASDGENMYIYKPSILKRVMFFAFIYEGASDFRSVSGRMFFKIGNGEEVALELNNPSNSRFCAAALITCNNQQISISKEEKYFPGHPQADAFYGFGFNWRAGSK